MAEPHSDPDTPAADAAAAEGEAKRKFREALDRKNANALARSDHKDAGAKRSRSHGPLENRREFRRKSG